MNASAERSLLARAARLARESQALYPQAALDAGDDEDFGPVRARGGRKYSGAATGGTLAGAMANRERAGVTAANRTLKRQAAVRTARLA